jgi:hypothetical protein
MGFHVSSLYVFTHSDCVYQQGVTVCPERGPQLPGTHSGYLEISISLWASLGLLPSGLGFATQWIMQPELLGELMGPVNGP